MTTLLLHHYYVPKSDWTYLLNFHEEFDNADHIGREAVLETYDRLFNKWKTIYLFLRELRIVLNHRISFWDDMHHKELDNPKYTELTLLYLDLYEKIDTWRVKIITKLERICKSWNEYLKPLRLNAYDNFIYASILCTKE